MTRTPTLPRHRKEHGNGPIIDMAALGPADQAAHWQPPEPRTDWTLLEVFDADTIYIGTDGWTHTNPDCAGPGHRTTTNWHDRGVAACFDCVTVDIIPTERIRQPTAKGLADHDAKAAHRRNRPTGKIRPDHLPTDTEVEQWLTDLGRKVTPADVTVELAWAATLWAERYDGDFGFMVDMAAAAARNLARNEILSLGQAKGVLNCWRADIRRREPAGAPVDGPAPVDLGGVPAGMYAVPDGDTRLKVRIDKPDQGKWSGWVFVSDGAEYGSRRKYGAQRPGGPYRGDIESQLAAIAADPLAAMAAYGRLTGSCGACGRLLEDAESVERGIGPVCWAKLDLLPSPRLD